MAFSSWALARTIPSHAIESQQICFLPDYPPEKSRSEKKLALSKARSHTAVVLHKRRETRRDGQMHYFWGRTSQVRIDKASVKSKNYEMLGRPPDDDGAGEAVTGHISLISPLHEHLDPFLRLAGDLPFRDRNLLHCCMPPS
jgi:hypothetical protein